MKYLFETYYWIEKSIEPRSTLVTVLKYLLPLATKYKFETLVPKSGKKKLRLDGDTQKPDFIEELLKTALENSMVENYFHLELIQVNKEGNTSVLFGYYETLANSFINLTESQFVQFQNFLESNHLPADLYYPEGAYVKVPVKGLLGKLGVYTGYSPKLYKKKFIHPNL